MLSEATIKAITLRAPVVHLHADQVYFPKEINALGATLKGQPYLNFFVRYRVSSGSGEGTHRWSRIVKVVSIADTTSMDGARNGISSHGAPASSQMGSPLTLQLPEVGGAEGCQAANNISPAATDSIVWRGKVFWCALVVVGEERPVYLPRLSAGRPTDAEIEAFCLHQATHNPQEVYDYTTGPEKMTGVPEGGHPPRSYIPTDAQAQQLAAFWQSNIVAHKWTEEEIDSSTALKTRLSHTGAAAAPVAATLNHLHNYRLATKLMSREDAEAGHLSATAAARQPKGRKGPSYAAAPFMSRRLGGYSSPPHSPIVGVMSQLSSFSSPQQPKDEDSVSVPSPIPTPNAATNSPFLPKRLRDQQRSSQCFTSGPASSQFTPTTTTLSSIQSMMLLGASQRSGDDLRSTQGDESLIEDTTFTQWQETAEKERQFFAYANNEQRAEYINKVAAITLRNRDLNRKNRLRGIESEKRLQRVGNLNESAGLWITDDKLRACKAAEYKAAMEGAARDKGSTNAQATSSKINSTSTSGGEARSTQSPEDALLDRFIEKHTSQEVRVDAIPDDWLLDTPALELPVVKAPTVITSQKVSPYVLQQKSGSTQVLLSQVLHRSAARMALKRSRSAD